MADDDDDTLVAALEAKAREVGNTAFATCWSYASGISEILSFRAFANASASGAARLTSLGVGRGERCAMLAKGTIDFYVAVMSVQQLGCTPVLLNWRQALEQLEGMVADTASTTLIAGAPYLELGRELGVRCGIERFVALDADFVWEKRYAAVGRDRGGVEAAVFFTSGSTSRPKPVLHTHATLLWTARNFVFPTPDMRTTLCFMPNFHVLMCFQNFLLPMARGVGCSIHAADATESITSQMLLAAARALEPTTIDTVPFIMAEWSALSPEELAPLAKCAAVRSGGAPLRVAVAQRLVDAGVRVQTHYGQTEAPGMQLLTVPGAGPSELAIFRPPWSATEVRLDDDTGELLIKGCKGSSPGYLKDGELAPSRVDAAGWHHTGDVFRVVKTRSGEQGLEHVSRVDDVLLLSTGEMFNPVPIEADIENLAAARGLRLARVVILGRDRPTPFLVVECVDDSPRTATTELESIVDQVNSKVVEYARIRKGHILATTESLPHSAKGNVQRGRAEVALAATLDEMTEAAAAAAAEVVDWDALRAAAAKAGYDDVDQYLAEKGTADLAEMGVDSLGIASLTSRELKEAERIGDNVKAWMITCVMMAHWYEPVLFIGGREGVGSLQVFYDMNCDRSAKWNGVSLIVQFVVVVSCFVTSFFSLSGPTVCIAALFFATAFSDGIRDGKDRRVALGAREKSMVILILFYKVALWPLIEYAYVHAWWPKCFEAQNPILDSWFIYALLWFRFWTLLLQKISRSLFSSRNSRRYLRREALALVGISLLFQIARDEMGENTTLLTVCIPGMPRIMNVIMNIIFNDSTNGVLRSATTYLTAYGLYPPHGGGPYVLFYAYVSDIGHSFMILSDKYFKFYPIWLLGYYYGDRVVELCRRLNWRAIGNGESAVLCVLAAFASNWALLTLRVTWLSGETPTPFKAHINRGAYEGGASSDFGSPWLPMYTLPDWIWSRRVSGVNTVRDWNPVWARILYIVMDYATTAFTTFFVVAACTLVSWRAARCGNAALGKYMLLQTFPTAYVSWLLFLVWKLGLDGRSSRFSVQLAQLTLLLGWPFVFVYTAGPLMTAFIVAVPKFVFWLLLIPTGKLGRARDEAAAYLKALPTSCAAWWHQYFDEIRRDSRLLRAQITNTTRFVSSALTSCTRDVRATRAAFFEAVGIVHKRHTVLPSTEDDSLLQKTPEDFSPSYGAVVSDA